MSMIRSRYPTALVAGAAALFALPVVSAFSYAPVFASCVSTTYVPDGDVILGATSATDCANQCYEASTDNVYSAWTSTTSACQCATTVFTTAEMTSGSAGGCGADYEIDVIHTTWDFYECTANYNIETVGVQSSTTDFDSILTTCRTYPFAAIWPSQGLFYYLCGSGTISDDTSTTCGYQIVHLYTHPADATASGLARRNFENQRRMVREEQQRLEVQYCPRGMTACALVGDASSYECLDTASELESCGGCVYGTFVMPGAAHNATSQSGGQDCSALQGVALGDATCFDGQCHYTCSRGYKKTAQGCVKI